MGRYGARRQRGMPASGQRAGSGAERQASECRLQAGPPERPAGAAQTADPTAASMTNRKCVAALHGHATGRCLPARATSCTALDGGAAWAKLQRTFHGALMPTLARASPTFFSTPPCKGNDKRCWFWKEHCSPLHATGRQREGAEGRRPGLTRKQPPCWASANSLQQLGHTLKAWGSYLARHSGSSVLTPLR